MIDTGRRRKRVIFRKYFLIFGSGIVTLLFSIFIAILVVSNVNENLANSTFLRNAYAVEMPLELSNTNEIKLDETFARAAGTIYLTFDDGPGEHTAKLLDILKAKNVKATFFVTGNGDDDLILREYNEGHSVGLHSWSHRYDLIYVNAAAYFEDLNLVHDRVLRVTGQDSRLIRFPGGSSNLISAKYDGGARIMSFLAAEVERRGFSYFDWNIASGDAGSATTSDEVFVNIAAHLKPGDNVVLQHDIKGFSVDAVERVIDYGIEHGYKFKALSADSPGMHHGINN